MDKKLEAALEFIDFQKSISTQKKILLEKLDANLTLGYSGGLFKIDQQLIMFIEFLIQHQKTENVILLDANKTPIVIADIKAFKDIILDKYFSALSYHLAGYDDIKFLRKHKFLENL